MQVTKSTKAQAMLEFALVFPVLIVLVYGIVELGRLLFIYSALTTASREAARWGSAAGPGLTADTPKYNDCLGIRTAARRSAILMSLTDGNITIHYDGGPDTADGSKGMSCPASSVKLGDRIVVSVTSYYAPIMPVPGISGFSITMKSGRTIMKDIEIKGTPQAGGGGGGGGGGTPTPSVSFSLASDSIAEDGGTYTLNVILDVATANDVSVNIGLGGTAAFGTNYTFADTTVTIPAGSLSQSISINVLRDNLYNLPKTVILTLSSPVNANLGSPNPFQLNITNVDPPPVARFQIATSTISETSGSAVVAVILTDSAGNAIVSGMATQVSFGLGGTAVLGTNYNLSIAPLVIPAGQGIGFILITPLDDNIFAPDLTIILTLQSAINADDGTSAGIGSPTTHTATLKDTNFPHVNFKNATLTVQKSAGIINIEVILDRSSSLPIDVSYSVGGTALSPSQYSIPGAHSVTFTPGSTSAFIPISLVNSLTPQGDITVQLTLGTPTQGALLSNPSVFVLTIQDTYNPPSAYFEYTANIDEGQSAVLNVKLSGYANAAVTIPLNLAGSALINTDYTSSPALPTSVTIPLGQLSATVDIATLTDLMHEGAETIIVTMSTPIGGSVTKGSPNVATFSILDADPVPTVYFNGLENVVAEDAGAVTIPLTMTGKSAYPVTVTFAVATGVANPAVADVDFVSFASYVVTFPPQGRSASITVSVLQNPSPDLNPRNLVLNLVSPVTNAVIGSPSTYTLTIRDNQICPRLTATPDRVNKKLTLFLINDRQYATSVTVTSVTVTWSGDANNRTNQLDWLDSTPTDTLTPVVKSGVAVSVTSPHIWSLATTSPPAPLSGYRLLFTFKTAPILNSTYTVSITFSNNCVRTTTAVFNP